MSIFEGFIKCKSKFTFIGTVKQRFELLCDDGTKYFCAIVVKRLLHNDGSLKNHSYFITSTNGEIQSQIKNLHREVEVAFHGEPYVLEGIEDHFKVELEQFNLPFGLIDCDQVFIVNTSDKNNVDKKRGELNEQCV